MDTRDRLDMIRIMTKELTSSAAQYFNAKDQGGGAYCQYGYSVDQTNCKSSLERKIITIREQLNALKKEL